MGLRNKNGGSKTKGMARGKNKKRNIAEKLTNSYQMFGQVTLIAGPTFKVMCSDGIERTAPSPGTRKTGRLEKGSWVLIDTTNKEYCTILSQARPNEDAVSSLKKDEEK